MCPYSPLIGDGDSRARHRPAFHCPSLIRHLKIPSVDKQVLLETSHNGQPTRSTPVHAGTPWILYPSFRRPPGDDNSLPGHGTPSVYEPRRLPRLTMERPISPEG